MSSSLSTAPATVCKAGAKCVSNADVGGESRCTSSTSTCSTGLRGPTIKFCERANSADKTGPRARVLASCVSNTPTYTGEGNNVKNPTWGAAGAQLLRVAEPPAYADGISTLAEYSNPVVNPRVISNTVSATCGVRTCNSRLLSDFAWSFGQFIDHTLDLTPSAVPLEPITIDVAFGDPTEPPGGCGGGTLTMGGMIPMNRSVFDPQTGTSIANPRQQINTISAFIDADNVYGDSPERARALRTNDGTGRLKTTCGPDGELPPYNKDGLPNATEGPTPADEFYLVGDLRGNENSLLLAVHTLFIREHNRYIGILCAKHPEWRGDGERLYQEARRYVTAVLQAITFNEFLPALLGANAMGAYKGYDCTLNPGIVNEFSTALYRLHTLVSEKLLVQKPNDTFEAVPLRDVFFNPDFVRDNGIGGLLFGAANHLAEEVDTKINDSLRNFLFHPPEISPGMLLDLAAINIQRGRDHGLQPYNATRVAYGLAAKMSFAQITSNLTLQQGLAALYGTVEEIDLWIGAFAEDHVAGSSFGELVQTALVRQFNAVRHGDRFWYENPGVLSKELLHQVNKTTLADLIRLNVPPVANCELQSNVFFLASKADDKEPPMV